MDYALFDILGRVLFGGYFLWNGITHFKDYRSYAGYAAHRGVPMPTAGVLVSGALITLGGLGILLNMYWRPALVAITLFLIPVTYFMHAFWKESDPQARSGEKIAFLKNVALIGAALLLF
ncbi:MAG: DoxX family membrane protein [Candidatus Pacebacteria bacterium]|nr:DoxX family membrane protein [Candidatus Paceibacterota bacterium]